MGPLCHGWRRVALHDLPKLAHLLGRRAAAGAKGRRKIRVHFANPCGGGPPAGAYRGSGRMRPELLFHTKGFAAGADLAKLASRRADVLLRQAPGLARIRLVVVGERLPNGAGVYAARIRAGGSGGATEVTEIAHDPDAAIQRAFLRLGRRLGGAPGAARARGD